ncbi:MAG: glycerol-3-phosphate 1-O-acyltransferase PlsY [Lachnospiraceae bacterium]|nr:glycerol-3-phosphate 1-O-acyltransferase PlsY [Lachnospiraceae bacterium]
MTFPDLRIKGLIGWYLGNGSKTTVGGIALLILAFLVPIAVGYFLGSLNFSLIISKKKFGEDVREHGSGNAGTTNMLRTYGKTAAVMTLLGDFMKAVVSALIGTVCFGMMGAHLAGLACIVGHAFPIYYHFKGGKGVACAAGMILAISPVTFLILFLFFAIIVGWTKYVSLGSIMCMLLYPVILDSVEPKGAWMIVPILCTALVVWLHRENIKRLREGKENKISFGKKK